MKFIVFLKVRLIILVIYISFFIIIYKSKAYYSYNLKLLNIRISIIIIY